MRYAQAYTSTADELIQLFISTNMKQELLHEINSNILKLRKMLKKTYPILPAQDLIGELSMVLGEEYSRDRKNADLFRAMGEFLIKNESTKMPMVGFQVPPQATKL